MTTTQSSLSAFESATISEQIQEIQEEARQAVAEQEGGLDV